MIVLADSDGQQVPNYARLDLSMGSTDMFTELVATYRKHGWHLRRALLRPETRVELQSLLPGDVVVREAEFDALWFSRPSHNEREAWELRLLAQTQYALFETFEADETEEERDDLRLEMEARLREYLATDKRG